MDTRLIHKTSEKLKFKISWVTRSETEWEYCGAADEVKWSIVVNATSNFFHTNKLFVATTRSDSFETDNGNLISSINQLVGAANFFVWSEDFQKVIEFNKIGVFRRGEFNTGIKHPGLKISYNKIKKGSPDKVKGKLVKYRKGDCLSLDCSNGKYLAAFISEKFNKYYDFTLLEFYENREPVIDDFVNGRFFGCYTEAMEKVYPLTERLMLPCLDVDIDSLIKKVGSLKLIDLPENGSYAYRNDIAEILQHFQQDLPQRQVNTENFDKRPDHIFISNRLIEVKKILHEPES